MIAAALRPRSVGGAVLALERGFALEDAAGTVTKLDVLSNVPGLGMNEGGCDSDGRFPGLFPCAGFPAAAGYPDGLTVDGDAGVWVVVFGGSTVRPVREFAD